MNRPFEVFLKLVFLAFIFSSCSYEKTTLSVGSLLDPTWDFSDSTAFEFDENYVEVKDGQIQLKPLDLKHEGEDFVNGSHVNTYSDDSRGVKFITKMNSSLDVRQVLPEKVGSLITYLKFDSSLENLADNGQDATITGSLPYSSFSKVGSSSIITDFSAANILQVQDADVGSSAFTASVWINPSAHNDWGRLLAESYVSPDQDWLLLEHSDDGRWYFVITMSNGVSCGTNSSGYITVPLNSWTHLTGVYSGASVSLYQNGILASGPYPCALPIRNDNSNLTIGSNGNGGSGHDASIDEVAIWEAELNPDEIYKLYKSQSLNFSELSPGWTPHYDNIVGYWKMDGNWQDSSGNGNHGTAFGNASFDLQAVVGTSSSVFDGLDDYVEIANESNFDFDTLNSFSLSLWVRIDDDNTDFETIIDKRGLLGGGAGTPGWNIHKGSAGQVVFKLDDGVSIGEVRAPANSLKYQAWTHILAVYSGAQSKIYINGDDSTSLVNPVVGSILNNLPVRFAYDTDNINSRDLHGAIDDVAIFNINLDESDAKMIYNRQKQKYAAHYDSEVIRLGGTSANWPDLSWSASIPFGKELVGDFNNDGNSDSESSSDYSGLSGDLSNGLVGYWSLNETEANSVAGSDFEDLSLNNNHGDETGGVSLGKTGYFNQSTGFDRVDDLISIPHSPVLTPTDAITLSAWFKTDDPSLDQRVVSKTQSGGYYISLNSSDGFCPANTLCFLIQIAGIYREVSYPTSNLTAGTWYQVTASYDGSIVKLYLNGVSVGTPLPLTGSITYSSGSDFCIGAEASATNCGVGLTNFKGKIDEVAIWSRGLIDTEVKQLYRRGANRIKFQVKSCIDSTCACKSFSISPQGSATDCDGDTIVNALDFDDSHKAQFIGPGGDGTTYFSESFNRKSTDTLFNCANNTSDSDGNICVDDEITFVAGPRPTAPIVSYDDLPLSARPDPNPYFQYRVYMEADENMACDDNPCLPELSSVNLNPGGSSKYYGVVQEIKPTKFISYNEIQSAKINADTCASFQLSPNGTNYYYWGGSAWALATGNTNRASLSDVENNIAQFGVQFGPGKLYIKSFLSTNSSQTASCSIREIDVNYSSR